MKMIYEMRPIPELSAGSSLTLKALNQLSVCWTEKGRLIAMLMILNDYFDGFDQRVIV